MPTTRVSTSWTPQGFVGYVCTTDGEIIHKTEPYAVRADAYSAACAEADKMAANKR